MHIRLVYYLGMEYSSLKEKSVAVDPVQQVETEMKPSSLPSHFWGKNTDFSSGALLGTSLTPY